LSPDVTLAQRTTPMCADESRPAGIAGRLASPGELSFAGIACGVRSATTSQLEITSVLPYI
jgi:hypothetical protein